MINQVLEWLSCDCRWKPFATIISNCSIGSASQIAGMGLLAFAAGAGIYYGRYWWAVGKLAEAEIEKVFK